MTALPTPSPGERWLLEVTIQSAHADDTRWDQQRAALRSVASYDGDTQIWTTWIGALNPPSVAKLQTLFDAARRYGTDVRLEHAPPGLVDGPGLHGRRRGYCALGDQSR
ncbi:hypothetical protein [Streptomyces sp. NPDC056683]|uniref:hypothetical protein n=1 Tax=Streptomyces sp. NPDC056683 TaxID=3345910 RepID=UPI003688E99D